MGTFKKEDVWFLEVKYADGEPQTIRAISLIKGTLGGVLGTHTRRLKCEVGQRLEDEKRDITILSTYRITRASESPRALKSNKLVSYRCNCCGEERIDIEEYRVLRGLGCAVCAGKKAIPITAPWMVNYFPGGEHEARQYPKCSIKEVEFQCPDCREYSAKLIRIVDLYTRHSIGCPCGDGISFPEKVLQNLLEPFFGTRYVRQVSRRKFPWAQNYLYDGAILPVVGRFDMLEDTIIIEMQGRHHDEYVNWGRSTRSRTLAEIKKGDKTKEDLAINNGIKPENYYAIDCRISEFECIKRGIKNSGLLELPEIDHTRIDWNDIFEKSLASINREIVNYLREYPSASPALIANKFGVSRDLVNKLNNKFLGHQKNEKGQRWDRSRIYARLDAIRTLVESKPQITYNEIASILNVDPTTIRDNVQKYDNGLDIRLRENGKNSRLAVQKTNFERKKTSESGCNGDSSTILL